jgi:hypothetical protein
MRTFPRKNALVLPYVLGLGLVSLAGQANAGCLSGLAEGAPADKSSTPSPTAASVPLVQAASPIDRARVRRRNSFAPVNGTTTNLSSDCGSS